MFMFIPDKDLFLVATQIIRDVTQKEKSGNSMMSTNVRRTFVTGAAVHILYIKLFLYLQLHRRQIGKHYLKMFRIKALHQGHGMIKRSFLLIWGGDVI